METTGKAYRDRIRAVVARFHLVFPRPSALIRSMRNIPVMPFRWIRLTLSYLWRRMMLRTTVIAITGSTGKTTAKECLAAVLQRHGRTLKTFRNQNDQLGVPRTILAMRPWHRFAVVEVATGKPGDIRRSARVLKPDIAIILGVGRTHTDKFRTLDDTAAEKSALLDYLPRRGAVILNGDDQRVSAMAARSGVKPDAMVPMIII